MGNASANVSTISTPFLFKLVAGALNSMSCVSVRRNKQPRIEHRLNTDDEHRFNHIIRVFSVFNPWLKPDYQDT